MSENALLDGDPQRPSSDAALVERRRDWRISSGMIEGLGPREYIAAGDLPRLASNIRTARMRADEMLRLPDVPPNDDEWIRQVQRTPTADSLPTRRAA